MSTFFKRLLGLFIVAAMLATVAPAQKPAETRLAPAAVLYDNGPFNTGTTTTTGIPAPAGTSLSEVQNGFGTIGFSWNVTTLARLADDFTIPAGQTWTIGSVTVYGYVTNTTTPSPFTTGTLRIWNGAPNAGGTVVFGDTTTNRLVGSTDTTVYRVTSTTVNTARRIWANTLTVSPPLTLSAGTYWVDCDANAGFVPPVTILGQTGKPGANAIQFFNGAWQGIIDGTTSAPQDVPFLINSSVVTAAALTAEGRAVDGFGRALPRVVVTLTDSSGVTRTAKTNSFGIFRFESLPAGETYILSGAAKGFEFQPFPVTLMEDAVGLELRAR